MILTGGGVDLLTKHPSPMKDAEDLEIDVQVIPFEEGLSKATNHTMMVTLSDGQHFVKCFLSPKLFHLMMKHNALFMMLLR